MAVAVYWDETLPNVLIWKYMEKWTWKEVFEAFEQEVELHKSLNGAHYDSITDLTECNYLAKGPGVGLVYSVLQKRQAWNYGITVVATQNMFLRIMASTLPKVYPKYKDLFIGTQTMKAAYEQILEYRQKYNIQLNH